MSTFDRLVTKLKAEAARFRVIEHEPEGRSERVAAIRGTRPSQGAKAIVCRVVGPSHEQLVVAVLSGDRRLDTKALAALLGGRKASFAPPSVAEEVTGCPIGAIPPVSFNDQLTVVADQTLLETEQEIAFNAGRLDRSIVLRVEDYKRIFAPKIGRIALS